MFCVNKDCKHTIFAETFNFIEFKSKKTSRLQNWIVSTYLDSFLRLCSLYSLGLKYPSVE